MQMLKLGESVIVEGEELIAGAPNCGSVRVTCVQNSIETVTDNSNYGMVAKPGLLVTKIGTFHLLEGMYFCINGPIKLVCNSAVLIENFQYKCLNTVGGPAEKTGRLKYINGCTDTVIINPAVIGDPCMNLLHFPKNVNQTMHTHPSLRCGITLSGNGIAAFPDGNVPLTPGSCWFLATGKQHSFHTKDSELLVSAWHPDSDTGPSHDDHPMINKTLVDGVSAVTMKSIRTV